MLPRYLVASLLLAILAFSLLPATTVAQVSPPAVTIQPGVQVNRSCTLNFVYDGIDARAGSVYIGTAAHCVEHVGQRMRIGSIEFGSVAYMGNGGGAWSEDYALIEVDSDRHVDVRADLKGHPDWPSGTISYNETGLGDLVGYSGYGMGFSATPFTREERVGIIQSDNGQTYTVQGPAIFGDSGGPIVHHETGKAYGIVSGAQFCCPYATRGPTVEHILSDAPSHGFPIELRTV